jgi:hypothetical protein
MTRCVCIFSQLSSTHHAQGPDIVLEHFEQRLIPGLYAFGLVALVPQVSIPESSLTPLITHWHIALFTQIVTTFLILSECWYITV